MSFSGASAGPSTSASDDICANSSMGGGRSSANARPSGTSRPPLPHLRSLPTSRASSREGSPRSAFSEAPSLGTQALARLAQYRAGPRVFKADDAPRCGLSTGDIVVFRTRGFLLAATPVSQLGADPEAVLHVLAPSDTVDPADRVAHLEVIRQGQWLGFRSQASGDRLLQVRRRGAHRLAFFSANLGTWEQWELAEAGAVDAVPWRSVHVTLRNRRMPTCELAVEIVRVGTATLMPHTALTPRSLAVGGTEEEAPVENQNIRRMSGLMVHEWLNFVEREKRVRAALEARVEQAVEDAAGLREWAATQVEGVRKDVEDEIEQLLAALAKKGAALEDVKTRLTTRLRWGIALLEAKKAAVLGRRVLLAWKARAARSRYAQNVVAKLQERSALRAGVKALQSWSDVVEEQRERQQRLRLAVRRMATLKMHVVFSSWLEGVREKKEEAATEAALQAAADTAMRTWHARRLVAGWRQRASRAREASRVLRNMAVRTDGRLMHDAFSAWQGRVAAQKRDVAGLGVRVAASATRSLLHAALDSWRVSVEDTFGGRMQVMHAVRVMSRRRGVRALQAWGACVASAKADAQRWRQVEALDRRRCLAKVLGSWREFAFDRRGNRDVFVRFVHARAERRMLLVFAHWRAQTQRSLHAAAVVHHSVHSAAVHAVASALTAWRGVAAEAKVARHRVAVCSRRRRTCTMRSVLAAWKETAQEEREERRLVAAFRAETVHRRGARALLALRQHAAEVIEDRQREAMAAGWHAGRLQARALWALEEALHRHRELQATLRSVAEAVDYTDMKAAWEVWQQAVGQAEAVRQAVAKFQRRRDWFAAKRAFAAWRGVCTEAAREQVTMARGVARLAESRSRWALAVWRTTTADARDEDQAAEHGRRRLERLRLGAFFHAWRMHTEDMVNAVACAEAAAAERQQHMLHECVGAWSAQAALEIRQREGVLRMVQQQAAAVQLTALQGWYAQTQESLARKALLRQAVIRLGRVRLAACMAAWRQQTEDGVGEATRLDTIHRKLSRKHDRCIVHRLFATWRGRTTEVSAALQATDARRAAQDGAMLRFAFISWRNFAEAMASHRERGVMAVQRRSDSALLVKAFAGWRHETHMAGRHGVVMLHAVERAALRTMRTGFEAWRQAAHARRVRRTALVRFMQRMHAARAASALKAWRGVAAQATATRVELERCLVRKRVAFRLFRQTYWESFDEDLQATLAAMFSMEADLADAQASYGEDVEGASIWPVVPVVPSPSPIKSLLSSPVRRQLQQQREEDAAAARADADRSAHSELSARVQAALASAEASPAPALPAPSQRLGQGIMAPLVSVYAGDMGPSYEAEDEWIKSYPGLPPVPEASEGDYGAASPSPARSQMSSQASTVATTAPTPPRSLHGLRGADGPTTPPFTGLSSFATPDTAAVLPGAAFGTASRANFSALDLGRTLGGMSVGVGPAEYPTPVLGVLPGAGTLPAAPGTVYRTPMGDFTPGGKGAVLTGEYKMRSLSAAASHLPPSGTKVAFPWLSLAGTPPLLDNPLAVAEGQDNE